MTRSSLSRYKGIRKSSRKKSRVTKDGRVILTGKDYQKLRWEVWERDRGECQLKIAPDCKPWVHLHEMELDHVNGRGMGGGRRDDTPESTKCACRPCNQLKGSKRLEA